MTSLNININLQSTQSVAMITELYYYILKVAIANYLGNMKRLCYIFCREKDIYLEVMV